MYAFHHILSFYANKFENDDRDCVLRKLEKYEALMNNTYAPERNWDAQAAYDEQWGTYNGYSELDYQLAEREY